MLLASDRCSYSTISAIAASARGAQA